MILWRCQSTGIFYGDPEWKPDGSLLLVQLHFLGTQHHQKPTETQGWHSGDGLNRHQGVSGHCRDMPVSTTPWGPAAFMSLSLALLFRSGRCHTFSSHYLRKHFGPLWRVVETTEVGVGRRGNIETVSQRTVVLRTISTGWVLARVEPWG